MPTREFDVNVPIRVAVDYGVRIVDQPVAGPAPVASAPLTARPVANDQGQTVSSRTFIWGVAGLVIASLLLAYMLFLAMRDWSSPATRPAPKTSEQLLLPTPPAPSPQVNSEVAKLNEKIEELKRQIAAAVPAVQAVPGQPSTNNVTVNPTVSSTSTSTAANNQALPPINITLPQQRVIVELRGVPIPATPPAPRPDPPTAPKPCGEQVQPEQHRCQIWQSALKR